MEEPVYQLPYFCYFIDTFVEEDILWRTYWRVLDRAQNARPIKINLIHDINKITLRYLDDTLKWHEQWPLMQPTPLKAIEVTLTLVKWGTIIRLFQVPDIL